MTRSFSAGLAAHLQGQRATLATCLLLTRQDGRVFGFSTHDKAFTFGGVVYEPKFSINPSDVSSNSNMDLDNLSAQGLLDSETITEADWIAGKWDAVDYRLFQVNWADLSQGDKKDSKGRMAETSAGRQAFVAELLGMMEAYTITIGYASTAECRTRLGTAECGVDLVGGSPSRTVTGTITADAGDFYKINDSSRTEADDIFTQGRIEFTSGDAMGMAYDVKSYKQAGGEIITKTAIGFNVLGATYTMTEGCDGLRTTCRDRFSNVVNFRGEPWRRGTDALVQIGRHGD